MSVSSLNEFLPPPLSAARDGLDTFTGQSVTDRLPRILGALLAAWTKLPEKEYISEGNLDRSEKSVNVGDGEASGDRGAEGAAVNYALRDPRVRRVIEELMLDIATGAVLPVLSDPKYSLAHILNWDSTLQEKTSPYITEVEKWERYFHMEELEQHQQQKNLSTGIDETDGSAEVTEQNRDLSASTSSQYNANRPTWYSAPWLVVEHYVYRLLLSLSGFLYSADILAAAAMRPRVDIFLPQKARSLESGFESIATAAPDLVELLDAAGPERESGGGHGSFSVDALRRLLLLCLWGNRADLSLSVEGAHPEELGEDYLLINDCQVVDRILRSDDAPGHTYSVHLVQDNAGFELLADLVFASFLARTGRQVHIWLKAYPWYVSDSMREDVYFLLNWLQSKTEHRAMQQLGKTIRRFLDTGKITLRESLWCHEPAPMFGSNMPDEFAVTQDINSVALVILKGDVNYRRFFGDRHWDYDANALTAARALGQRVDVPILLLRSNKSSVCVGVPRPTWESAAKRENDWLTAGRFGVIQLVDPH